MTCNKVETKTRRSWTTDRINNNYSYPFFLVISRWSCRCQVKRTSRVLFNQLNYLLICLPEFKMEKKCWVFSLSLLNYFHFTVFYSMSSWYSFTSLMCILHGYKWSIFLDWVTTVGNRTPLGRTVNRIFFGTLIGLIVRSLRCVHIREYSGIENKKK